MNLFAVRFKELKEKKNITYTEIANQLGLKRRAVQCYPEGSAKPDFEGLIALADLFDVSIDYLVGRTDNPKVNR